MFINLSDTTNQLLDSLWAEVKMGGPGQVGELIAILILFLGLYIGVVVYKRRKRAREQ